MKKIFAAIGLMLIFGTSTAMADIIPEGKKVVEGCASLASTVFDEYPDVVFVAAVYTESYVGGSTLPDSVEVMTPDTCISAGKYTYAELFAVNKKYYEDMEYAPHENFDPKLDISEYPLKNTIGSETFNTENEYLDVSSPLTSIKRVYNVVGIDNSTRTFSITLVQKVTNEGTEQITPATTRTSTMENVVNLKPVFTDVAANSPYEKAVLDLKRRGIVQGYDDGSFKPDALINRAEFTKIVGAARYPETQDCANTTPDFKFPDVDKNIWYADYLCKAFTDKIISGYPDGTFRPDANINYAEAAKITTLSQTVADTKVESDPWYQKYVDVYTKINSTPSTIKSPDQKITRGEMALMMEALFEHALELE